MTELEFKLLSMVGDDFKNSVELLNSCGYAPTVALDVLKHLITTKKYLKKTFAADSYSQCTVSLTADGRAALLSELEARQKDQKRAESEAKQKEDERLIKKREERRSRIHDLILVLVSALVAFLLDIFKMK